MRGRPAIEYSFEVSAAESRYSIRAEAAGMLGVVSKTVAQHGSVYIDRDTLRLVRISADTGPIKGLDVTRAVVQLDFVPGEVGGSAQILPLSADVRIERKDSMQRYRSEMSGFSGL